MKNVENERRFGVQRREFHYSVYIPERRNGNDRRIDKNAKRALWAKMKIKIKKFKRNTI